MDRIKKPKVKRTEFNPDEKRKLQAWDALHLLLMLLTVGLIALCFHSFYDEPHNWMWRLRGAKIPANAIYTLLPHRVACTLSYWFVTAIICDLFTVGYLVGMLVTWRWLPKRVPSLQKLADKRSMQPLTVKNDKGLRSILIGYLCVLLVINVGSAIMLYRSGGTYICAHTRGVSIVDIYAGVNRDYTWDDVASVKFATHIAHRYKRRSRRWISYCAEMKDGRYLCLGEHRMAGTYIANRSRMMLTKNYVRCPACGVGGSVW